MNSKEEGSCKAGDILELEESRITVVSGFPVCVLITLGIIVIGQL